MILSGETNYEKGIKIKSMQGNRTPEYDICTGNKGGTREMLEANEMKLLRKIVGKTKINRIKSQQIRKSCGIHPINEWVERR